MKNYKPEGATRSKFTGFHVDTLETCMNEGKIIEAPAIKCDNELNLYFDLGNNIHGILPRSEFEYLKDKKAEVKNAAIAGKVAKSTCFKVTAIDKTEDGEVNVSLSRKAAQQECYEEFISKLKVGQVIDARITHIENYGAFCDIGCGFIALLPIKHFCIARIKDPKVSLRGYRNIKVIVKSIDEYGRILLSQKELLGTWEEEAAKFKPGDTVIGTVRLVEEYGVFVELTPNLVGLAEPFEGVSIGDAVSVYVKAIIPDKMKVKLLVVESEGITKPYTRLDYRIPESGIVKSWTYSPEGATKSIESIIVAE